MKEAVDVATALSLARGEVATARAGEARLGHELTRALAAEEADAGAGAELRAALAEAEAAAEAQRTAHAKELWAVRDRAAARVAALTKQLAVANEVARAAPSAGNAASDAAPDAERDAARARAGGDGAGRFVASALPPPARVAVGPHAGRVGAACEVLVEGAWHRGVVRSVDGAFAIVACARHGHPGSPGGDEDEYEMTDTGSRCIRFEFGECGPSPAAAASTLDDGELVDADDCVLPGEERDAAVRASASASAPSVSSRSVAGGLVAVVAEDDAEAFEADAAEAAAERGDSEPAGGGGSVAQFTAFAGELQSRSMVLKQWKTSTFVLTAESLSAEKAGHTSLVVERAAVARVEVVDPSRELRITMQIDSLDRAAVYRAATAELLARWVSALRAAGWPLEPAAGGAAAGGTAAMTSNPMQLRASIDAIAVLDG